MECPCRAHRGEVPVPGTLGLASVMPVDCIEMQFGALPRRRWRLPGIFFNQRSLGLSFLRGVDVGERRDTPRARCPPNR